MWGIPVTPQLSNRWGACGCAGISSIPEEFPLKRSTYRGPNERLLGFGASSPRARRKISTHSCQQGQSLPLVYFKT
jgi:hypothetical protein